MRLWHQNLITKLPRQQLLGLHREICGMRGKGWGRKHSTVDYVWKYGPTWLYFYHQYVMLEMIRRGYYPDYKWANYLYRGKNCVAWDPDEYRKFRFEDGDGCPVFSCRDNIYPEHNDEYLQECLENLRAKGVELEEE